MLLNDQEQSAGESPEHGDFPLYASIFNCQFNITKTLLEHGATPDSKCFELLGTLHVIGGFPNKSYDNEMQMNSLNFRLATALMNASIGKSKEDVVEMCHSLDVIDSEQWQERFKSTIRVLEQYTNDDCSPTIKYLCICLLELLRLEEINAINYEQKLEEYQLDNQEFLADLSKNVNNSGDKYYSGLGTILESGIFIEPGAKLNKKLYPYFFELKSVLNRKDDFLAIQYVAQQAIDNNIKVKELNYRRDPTQINNRLALLEAIIQSSSIEEAFDQIMSKFPECKKYLELKSASGNPLCNKNNAVYSKFK